VGVATPPAPRWASSLNRARASCPRSAAGDLAILPATFAETADARAPVRTPDECTADAHAAKDILVHPHTVLHVPREQVLPVRRQRGGPDSHEKKPPHFGLHRGRDARGSPISNGAHDTGAILPPPLPGTLELEGVTAQVGVHAEDVVGGVAAEGAGADGQSSKQVGDAASLDGGGIVGEGAANDGGRAE
jgi:hypothetical protein